MAIKFRDCNENFGQGEPGHFKSLKFGLGGPNLEAKIGPALSKNY